MRFPFFGDSLPVMIVPYLKDTNAESKQELVKSICHRCAEQLSVHLFKWERKFPSRSTVKTWSASEGKFLNMDLSLFQEFIMNHFSVRTADNQEWMLDRSIAARIWEQCVSDESPLPPADWNIEGRKRKVA